MSFALTSPIRSRAVTGMMLMCASMLCFSIMNTAIRYTSAEVPSFLMVFWRNVWGVVILLPWLLHAGVKGLHTTRYRAHLVRAACGVIAMELWFYALFLLPVAEAVALSFITPIFVTIGASLILHEKVGRGTWLAVALGFIGVLIIARPGTAVFGPGAVFVLCSSCAMATSGLLVKALSRTESAPRTVFYMNANMMVISAPLAYMYWQPVSWEMQGMLLIVAVSSSAAHFCMIGAFKFADVKTVIPFDFTRLVFTAILAYLVFGEVLDFWTAIGAAIIMAGSIYAGRREARLEKEIANG
ncbi:MAG: DMT family transporter [Alphaproteobacteria bacterium]|nr:DMT family transporter [Alphaproteobacteria bacterium]